MRLLLNYKYLQNAKAERATRSVQNRMLGVNTCRRVFIITIPLWLPYQHNKMEILVFICLFFQSISLVWRRSSSDLTGFLSVTLLSSRDERSITYRNPMGSDDGRSSELFEVGVKIVPCKTCYRNNPPPPPPPPHPIQPLQNYSMTR